MTKGTRFFSRRLLPLLLAAIMLLGMLPTLTLPVLAEEAAALTNVAQGKAVSIHGPTSGADRPASWLTDGITDSEKYVEISKDTAQNGSDPSYAQIDLGASYDIAKVEFWNYWNDGRTLNGLVILASENGTFAEKDRSIIYNSDTTNFFGFGAGTDTAYKSVAAGLSVSTAAKGRYIRVMNNGHDGGNGSTVNGGHYTEIKVYGTEISAPVEPAQLYNVASGCSVTVNKWGSGSDRPNSWLTDGVKDNEKYIEVCKDKAQDTDDLSYAQIDLGNEYPVSQVNFWNYWSDGRTLKELHILLSTTADFRDGTTKEIYNKDWAAVQNGLEVPVDSPFTARYVRIWNNGHTGTPGDYGQYGGHYIEVEVMSTEAKKEPLPEEYKLRDRLNIPTYSYTAQSGQTAKAELDNTHPDVIDFAKTGKADGKWGGYRYWMVLTPNQHGYSQYENPCLAASEDGINWIVPEGIVNPLSGVAHEPAGTHNCDTDLVYNPDTDELWIYYIWEQDSPAGTPSNLRLIRVKEEDGGFAITSTTDGKPYERLINSQYRYDMQSPAIVRKSSNEWLMWSNNSDSDNSGNGWKIQIAFVELRTSTDGKNWANKQSLVDTLVLKGADGVESYIPWHLDVQWVESQNKYWGLFCAYPKGGNSNLTYLLFGTSEDGKTWTTYPKPLISPRDNEWDNNFIYRSTFVYDDTSETLQVWYSGGKSGGWRIGYTEFENFLTDTLPTLGDPYTPDTPTPPQPGEDGWVYVDSHSGQIQYTGNWGNETSSKHYKGSAKEANAAPGAAASMTFTGTGFRWVGQMDSNFGRARIYVDDVLVAIGNANSSTNPYQFTILELHGLENRQHTVRLEVESNAPIQIDAFAYYTGTDLDETVSSIVLEPSETIRLGDGESKPVLAMAMNAERVAVFRDDFSFALESGTVAGLSGDGKTQKTVTGKAAGRTNLHVTLPELSSKPAEAKIVVTSTEPAATPRMPVDAEHPLLLVSLYANTKHPDWWDDSGIPGVPMQGHNTLEGVWSLIPEDLKPYTAIQLHADDYLGHAWGGTGNQKNLQKFYEYHVAIAQEKGINLYLTLMTGGVPINTFRSLIDMDWLNDLIDNNSCIKGVVFTENHHNGDTDAVAQLTAEYLELFSSKGIYLVLTDIDNANHRMEKWFENDTLFKTAQKHHKYLVINSKSTSSSGYNTVRSFALGTWLSGLADNWGALTDAWAWYEIRYHKLFEPVMNTLTITHNGRVKVTLT